MSDIAALQSLTVADVEAAICDREPSWYQDHSDWALDCHSVSLAIVSSGLFRRSRVARGSCHGVFGQHSWVTLGDPYDPAAPILDATLWSYVPGTPVLWKGTGSSQFRHVPHGGEGSIWSWGRPPQPVGEVVAIDDEHLTAAARQFLGLLGPLDHRGWVVLFNAPVRGWPAREIITAAYLTPQLRALIPVDRVGMLTDFNPDGLYLPPYATRLNPS